MSKDQPIDASDMFACQLTANADFLSEADFIQPDGSYKEYPLKIAKITREHLQLPGQSAKQLKTVLAFEGAKKRLVCNKTNLNRIRDQLGKKVKDWLGKHVTVTFDPSVRMGPKRVGGVRVKELSK